VTAVVESNPVHGRRRTRSPCYITTGEAGRKVSMGYDVAGHSQGKLHQMSEIRVGFAGIHR
jgi:hypothetical protein